MQVASSSSFRTPSTTTAKQACRCCNCNCNCFCFCTVVCMVLLTHRGHGALLLRSIVEVLWVVVLLRLAVVPSFGRVLLVLVQQICVVVLRTPGGGGSRQMQAYRKPCHVTRDAGSHAKTRWYGKFRWVVAPWDSGLCVTYNNGCIQGLRGTHPCCMWRHLRTGAVERVEIRENVHPTNTCPWCGYAESALPYSRYALPAGIRTPVGIIPT